MRNENTRINDKNFNEINRINVNENVNYILNHKCVNIFRSIILYPYHRIFMENKIYGINNKGKRESFPTKASILKSVKSRNNYFAGITSFSVHSNLPIIFSFVYDLLRINKDINITVPHVLLLLPSFILSYPFLINSNRKVMNDSGFLNMKNPLNIIRLILNKNSYRGLIYHLFNSVMFYLPIFNLLFLHKYESVRFTYVFGKNEKGLKFNSYKEAKKFIINNDSINMGRGAFNAYLFGYYITLGFLFYEEYNKGKKNDNKK